MGSLHIDYRPRNFGEVVGNSNIIKSLKSILKRDKKDIPHAFLLQGDSGTGKTTIGRIIASELGCPEKTSDGEGNNDFIELDIAHFTGVDTAREIRQTIHYHPSSSSCRVWILDEFHKASNSFQNAMLKALEDAPKLGYFILLTTDPQKLLKTIRNRCSIFETKSLEEEEITELLNWVLNEEKFNIPDDVKDEITNAADGCPRQALVILDQIIDLPKEEMLSAVKDTNIDEKEVQELCQAMLKDLPWGKISAILKGLKNNNDPEKIRRSVLGYMSAVLLNGGNPKASLIIDCFRETMFHTGFPGIVAASYDALPEDIPF